MNITELESYNLADAIKFNDHLNPRLWDEQEHLKPDVREHLLKIAEDFKEFLGVSDLNLKDVTLSGSNASFTYTPHSDIDLHLVVEIPPEKDSEVYRELFNAKKSQYNDNHSITIGGYPVELYVQDSNQPHVSQGIYSLLQNKWIDVPKRRKADVNDISVKSKYDRMQEKIENAISSGSYEEMSQTMDRIKEMRQAGLAEHGEFGPENLAFKMLRSQGVIKKLLDARKEVKDRELSLAERNKVKAHVTYGFGESTVSSFKDIPDWLIDLYDRSVRADYASGRGASPSDKKRATFASKALVKGLQKEFGPDGYRRGYDLAMAHKARHGYDSLDDYLEGGFQEDASLTWDGVDPTTTMFLSELGEDASLTWDGVDPTTTMFLSEEPVNAEDVIADFVNFCIQKLNIDTPPKIRYKKDPQWSVMNKTFGRYSPQTNLLEISLTDRHIMDILRTVSHELTHCRQEEKDGLPPGSGNDGSKWENEANAKAGILMRQYGKMHPELFEPDAISEGASGYIPTKAQANDPRFKMALSVDVHPGTLGKVANAFMLDTDSQGRPQVASPSGKVKKLSEKLQKQLIEFKKPKQLVEHVTVYDMHKDFFEEMAKQGHSIYEDESTYLDLQDFLSSIQSDLPSVGTDYYYASVGSMKSMPFINIAKFTYPHKLIDILENVFVFDVHGNQKQYPSEPRSSIYDQHIYLFKNKSDLEKIESWLQLKFSNQLKISYKPLDEINIKETRKFMRAEEFIIEDELLDEVKMSPGALQKWAQGPETQGMKMGIEFEMCVPDAVGEENEYDYPQDDPVRDIDDFMGWYEGGDMAGSRELREMRSTLEENFFDWQMEGIGDYVANSDLDRTVYEILLNQSDVNEFMDQARDQLGDEADDDEVEEKAKELQDDYIQAKIEDQDSDWQYAYDLAREDIEDEARSDPAYSDEQWFRYMGFGNGSDVCNQYGFTYPYYNEGISVYEIADEFKDVIGAPVNASSSYHGGEREEGTWVVEPDSSIDTKSASDAGLEFISPAESIETTLDSMNRIWKWANEKGCYTNKSTGLHMNVSVPDYSRETLDYIKLAIFSGDKYILDQFQRAANSYCKAATDKIKANLTSENTAQVLEAMRTGLNTAASKIVHNGMTDKYTSINTKNGWVEFRSPGGDYLNRSPEELSMTALRFARALSIACDESAYQKEYAKKFYKLVAPMDSNNDTVSLFARYTSGELSQAELKSSLKKIQSDRQDDKDTKLGVQKQYTVYYSGDPENYNITVNASNPKQALEIARKIGKESEDQKTRHIWSNFSDGRYMVTAGPNRLAPQDDSSQDQQAASPSQFRITSISNPERSSVLTTHDGIPGVHEFLTTRGLDPNNFSIEELPPGWSRNRNQQAQTTQQPATGNYQQAYQQAQQQGLIGNQNQEPDQPQASTYQSYQVVNPGTGSSVNIRAETPYEARALAARHWGLQPSQVIANVTNDIVIESAQLTSKLWSAQVKVKQPNYVGYIDVTVAAPDMRRARTLIKGMYNVQEWEIGSTKEVKFK